MSFEERLEQKAKDSNFLSLDELGDTIKATIIGQPEFKADKRANEACYIQLKTANGVVVQKFGRSLYETLMKRVKEAGGLKALQETEHVWKQEKAGRATFQRYFPVALKTKQ